MTDTAVDKAEVIEVVEGEEDEIPFADFIKKNKRTWILFNLFTALGSICLAVFTYIVIKNVTGTCLQQSLTFPLWMSFVLHVVNSLETLISLTGLDYYLCNGKTMFIFVIFEVIMLSWMQFNYFQARECMNQMPLAYFALGLQILIFYGVVILTICFFFRKFCGQGTEEEEEVSDSDDEKEKKKKKNKTKSPSKNE